MENFTSNPGASKWITTSPGPGMIRHGVKQQKRYQLLEEAARMTPDQQELVKQLTDKELSGPDAALYGNILNQGLKSFADKYNENPFYAFSREGKETVASLQRLVRDPALAASSRAYKQSEEEFKKIRDSHLTGLVDVGDGGRMKVIRRDDGSIEEIMPDHFNPAIHQAATIEDLYQHKVGKLGFFHKDLEKIQPYSHQMEDPDKVIDQVNKWFQGLGQTQIEEIKMLSNKEGKLVEGLTNQKTTSNQRQVHSRLQAIYDKTGLSQQARNTLYSQYYTDAIQRGEKPTRQEAENALVNSLTRIAEGHNVFKQEDVARHDIQAAKTIKDSYIPVSPLEFSASNVLGAEKMIPIEGSKRKTAMGYVPIPTDRLMNVSSNTYKDDDTKDTKPTRNVKDLAMFQQLDQSDLFIPNLYDAGKLVPLPEALKPYIGELVVDPTFLGGSFSKPAPDGSRYVHGDERSQGIEGDGDRTLVSKVRFQGGRGGDYDKAIAALEALGYTPKPMTTAEQQDYKKNVNSPNYENEGFFSRNLAGGLDAYDFNLMGVYRDPNLFNPLFNLPTAYKSKKDQDLYGNLPGGAKQGGGEENQFEQNPFNKRFATFGDLSKP